MSVLKTVNTGCHNYFSPKMNIDRGQSLRAGAKIASYFLIFPPIIMGAFLGGTSICLSLVGRVKKEENHDWDAQYDWDVQLDKSKNIRDVKGFVQRIKKTDEILKQHPRSGFSVQNRNRKANIAAFVAEVKANNSGNFYHPENFVKNPIGQYTDMVNGVDTFHEALRLCTLNEIKDAFQLRSGSCMNGHIRTLEPLLEKKLAVPDLKNALDIHADQTLDQRIAEFIRGYENQKAKEHLEGKGKVATAEAVDVYKRTNKFIDTYMVADNVAELVADWCYANGYLGSGTTPCMVDGQPVVLTVDDVVPRIRSSIKDIYALD